MLLLFGLEKVFVCIIYGSNPPLSSFEIFFHQCIVEERNTWCLFLSVTIFDGYDCRHREPPCPWLMYDGIMLRIKDERI